MTTITLYSKTPCVQCDAVKRWLEARGVEYTLKQLGLPTGESERDQDALIALGYQGVPVLMVQEGTEPPIHWYGFDPGRMESHCTPKED